MGKKRRPDGTADKASDGTKPKGGKKANKATTPRQTQTPQQKLQAAIEKHPEHFELLRKCGLSDSQIYEGQPTFQDRNNEKFEKGVKYQGKDVSGQSAYVVMQGCENNRFCWKIFNHPGGQRSCQCPHFLWIKDLTGNLDEFPMGGTLFVGQAKKRRKLVKRDDIIAALENEERRKHTGRQQRVPPGWFLTNAPDCNGETKVLGAAFDRTEQFEDETAENFARLVAEVEDLNEQSSRDELLQMSNSLAEELAKEVETHCDTVRNLFDQDKFIELIHHLHNRCRASEKIDLEIVCARADGQLRTSENN